jgi:zinc transport system ATP-binding protein
MSLRDFVLEVENVNYRSTQPVLSDVSFNIKEGEYACLIGPNGAGKSTLLKIILGFLKPDTGKVRLFGESLENFKDWSKIGYVSQKSAQIGLEFPATVREVLENTFPRNKNINTKIKETLDLVGIGAFENKLINELSGGERQKVFLARSMMSDPKILLLDEPTVAIDTESQAAFYLLLKSLNATGVAIVMVTHDISVVSKESTKILCLNQKLLFHGTSKDFNFQALGISDFMKEVNHNH